MNTADTIAQGSTVLVVEDTQDTREALCDLLGHHGYRVHAVQDGMEAIRQASQVRYDAVVLDMRLPDIDGLSVLKTLIELDATLPVIVLTAYVSTESKIGSFRKGAFAYLPKPYNPEEMTATLRRAIAVRTLTVNAEHTRLALRESEERFRSVVQSATDAFVLADHRGIIISWNASAERLFGYLEKEVLGQPLTMLMPERYRKAHQGGIQRFHSTGTPHVIGKTVELCGLRKDGREFPLELSLATWKSAHGTFFSGIIRDITERKRAEEALRESELRFRQVTENIQEVFWMTDAAKTQMLYVSPAYEAIWGRSCNSLYASPSSWLDAIHPDDRARVLDAALTKQVDGKYDEVYRIVRPDGTIRWIQDQAFPVRDESGMPYRIAGIATDITAHQEAQEALRSAYDKIETILTSLPGAILIVDEGRQVVYANPLARTYFGGEPATIVGRSLCDVVPLTPAHWARMAGDLRAAPAENASRPREGEFESAKRVYRYRLFPVTSQSNGSNQTGLIIWDVTEQKQLQERLIQTEKLASLGTLVSGVAHEINNPVQGIIGMAEILLEEEDQQKVKEYVRDIAAYSAHIATIVRDFASYARASARDEMTAITLGERMAEALKMVRRCPKFGCVEVITAFQPVPTILARCTEIDQIFVNLISNAVQAMEGNGRLTLATRADSGTVAATITDTGHGIPKSLLGKIFDPFFTTKDPGKGTGLGLSVVHKLVTKYGGTISVDSEEGRGATFTVRFPFDASSVQSPTKEV